MNILDFTFNGKKLSDFRCICCNFDSSSGTIEVSAGADVTLNQEKPSGSNKFNLYSTSYDEPFTLSLSICLNPCGNYENMDISVEQARKIQKWLNLRNKKFKINAEGYEDIYWVGTFTCKQVMLNGAILGFNLTFTANTPYALQEDELFNIELSDTLESDIVFTSDVYGYIDADYIITGAVFFAQSPKGKRGVRFGTSTVNYFADSQVILTTSSTSTNGDSVCVQCTYIYNCTSTTTLYLQALQQLNKSLKITNSWMKAVRIG